MELPFDQIRSMLSATFASIYLLSQPPDSRNDVLYQEEDFMVQIKTGPISFQRTIPKRRFGGDTSALTLASETIGFGDGLYLIVLQKVSKFDQQDSLAEARSRAAEIVTLIDLEYRGVIVEKVFDGIVDEPGKFVMWPDGPDRIVIAPTVSSEQMGQLIESGIRNLKSLADNQRSRIRLMSRWYRRAQETLNEVDKFLYFYVAIEVFPAAGTTDVTRAVRDYLQAHVFQSVDKGNITERLKLGKITGFRALIVHDGKASISKAELEEFRDLLEILGCITYECLNLASGRQYQGSLAKWLGT